jgi:hypothetical protein
MVAAASGVNGRQAWEPASDLRILVELNNVVPIGDIERLQAQPRTEQRGLAMHASTTRLGAAKAVSAPAHGSLYHAFPGGLRSTVKRTSGGCVRVHASSARLLKSRHSLGAELEDL